jgi:Ca2+-binding RTX toxin-like protein
VHQVAFVAKTENLSRSTRGDTEMPTPTLSHPSFRLNTNTTGGQNSAAVAGLTDGRFVAVWRDDNGTPGVLKYAIFNADGTVAKSETVANQSTVVEIFAGDVAVAALTGGGFAITWSSRFNFQNDVFHRVFNSSGAAVTGDLTSNIGATLGDQRHPDIVGDGAGGFYVVWEDLATTPNVQLRHFNGTGQPVGGADGLSDLVGGDEVPAIAINRAGTQFAVVWDDDLGQTQGGNEDSIRGFLQGGVSEFRIDTGDYSHFHTSPDVAYSTGSNFMAVWSEFVDSTGLNHVTGRINGGGEFQINTSPHTNDTTMPVVVGLQSGNFLVVWNDGGFNGGADVLGQLFSVGGAKIGSEFAVTDFSVTSIARIEASELLDGRVLVTWDANKLNVTVGLDAFARIVDPRQGASNWLGTNAPEQYVGTGLADVLNGAGGNDRLWGEGGADQMTGGTGDDLFYVDNAGDKTFEAAGQGNDRVLTSASHALAAGQAIEVFATTSLAGTAAINLTGNDLAQRIDGNNGVNVINGKGGNDVLFGNGGNDTITGGPGTDTLNGGAGNDVYVLENGGDAIADSGGVDRITSTASRSIAPYATVENLTLLNVAGALAGIGNNLANTISGNDFNNTLTGGLGDDVLAGGNGSDTLTGGQGIDTLIGGAQNDFFVLNAPLNVVHRDAITDFLNVAGNNDTIHLENAVMTQLGGPGALAASKFFAGAAAHDADDRIIYNQANGAVYYDANGNAAGGSTHLATISNKPILSAADFVVI